MKKFIPLAILGILIITIGVWLTKSFQKAYQPQPQILQGQIAAREYNVSSKIAGRIAEIYVQKGQLVKKGELIYMIYSPELEAKLQQAQAGYEAAKALNEETQKGAREQQIISAKDMWLSAKTMRDLAEKTYTRVESLYKSGVVSLQKRDEAYANFEGAKLRESTAYQQYKLALEGASKETKRAVEEKERAAAGTVAEVEAYAKDSQVLAPADGEVSNILLHEGELAPSGFPVVLLADMSEAYLRLNITEDELKNYPKDKVFQAYIPALDQMASFKVTFVSVMGDFATWKSTTSNKGYDVRTFEVNAKPITPIPNLRIGMSVIIQKDGSKPKA
ncbi:HlyD family secretion protein [Helicobacter pametensis]|uniref:HlyD family secretion protein n=1 Tax=Helicobacter pametensis TaxID=95149 RepID=UPI000483ADE3|nr:biotin/lipoyl-binding protein [Helicobacter pametensis]